tara:strand:+ start:700 stop:1290 length:591 start_codon:yes stop_codon:yes gene_type:complete
MYGFPRISIASNGAKLIKTGQTISIRTGDDAYFSAGRTSSFLVLGSNNPFGNTNRFTDELGSTIYNNNWVIDWSTYDGSTVLGYFRTPQTAAAWNSAVDNSLGTFGTFSNCRLTNIRELHNIVNYENGNGTYLYLLQYSPFNITDNLWSSTSLQTQSSFAWFINTGTPGVVSYEGKGQGYKYIPCRTFTVTGTTLT